MARRSRAQLLAEFERLDEIFRALLAIWPESDIDTVPTRQQALARVAAGEATPGDLVTGWRQAVNDLALGLKDGLRRGDPTAIATVDAWRDRTGRDLLTEIGDPLKRAAAIARAERIADETEHDLVREVLSDVDAPLPADTLARLSALLGAYETALTVKGRK